MKKTTKILLTLFIFSMLIIPIFSLAYKLGDPLVPCGTSATAPCKFDDIIKLINNVINFILTYMVIPIVAILFAYAGFLLVTSGGQDSARTKAKDIFTNAVFGLIIAFAAWLIVKLTLSILGGTKILEMFFK